MTTIRRPRGTPSDAERKAHLLRQSAQFRQGMREAAHVLKARTAKGALVAGLLGSAGALALRFFKRGRSKGGPVVGMALPLVLKVAMRLAKGGSLPRLALVVGVAGVAAWLGRKIRGQKK